MSNNNVMFENANKLAYLIKEFPDRTIKEILNMLQMPPVQSNAGIWYAQELGWVEELDERKILVFKQTPEKWQFGELIENLEDQILYCFQHLAKTETDLEETFLTDWLTGYATQDVFVAVHHLLESKLATYRLVDHNPELGDSTYTYYTLKENLGKEWGKVNFKDSTVVDDTEVDDTPEEDKHLGGK